MGGEDIAEQPHRQVEVIGAQLCKGHFKNCLTRLRLQLVLIFTFMTHQGKGYGTALTGICELMETIAATATESNKWLVSARQMTFIYAMSDFTEKDNGDGQRHLRFRCC
jgi:hypothetical protein